MAGKGGIENRRSPRRVFKRPVGILLHGEYMICQALQLGEGGMMVNIPHEIKPGTRVVVTVFIPGGGHALVQAEVLYTNGQDNGMCYGMKFENLSLAHKRHVRNYVSAKTQAEATEERILPDFMNEEESSFKHH